MLASRRFLQNAVVINRTRVRLCSSASASESMTAKEQALRAHQEARKFETSIAKQIVAFSCAGGAVFWYYMNYVWVDPNPEEDVSDIMENIGRFVTGGRGPKK